MLIRRVVSAGLTEPASHGLRVPAGETGRKALATNRVGNYMIVAGAKSIYLVGLLPLRRDYILIVLRSRPHKPQHTLRGDSQQDS